MHIILMTVKIIGILLAAVLLLLLAILGMVLFVPVRYRIEARCGPEKYEGSAGLHWLGRLVRAGAAFSKGDGLKLCLRIAGFPIFERPKPAAAVKKKKKKRRQIQKSAKKSKSSGESRTGKPRSDKPAEEKKRAEQPARTRNARSEKAEKNSSDVQPRRKSSEPVKKDEQPAIREEKPKRKPIFERAEDFFKKLRDIGKKLKKIASNIEEKKRKLDRYLTIWNDEETQKIRHMLKKDLLCLWKHYRPRKIRGRIHFGFSDPSLTGQAAGVLYLLFSSPGDEIAICPEFETEETILDGEGSMSGRIRLFHIVRIGILLFFNRELRRLIEKVKWASYSED